MPAFVGRAEPLARLTAAYQAVAAAPGDAGPGWAGLVLVTGEAGIGKTALLTRFAAEVAAAGGVVVWGTCWDGDQAPAWWPWTQALRALLDDRRGPARWTPAASWPPSCRSSSRTRPPPTDAGRVDPADRVRLFDAVARLLRRAADRRAVVVVLDDLQWADASTVDLLRFLAAPAPARAGCCWSARTGRTSRGPASPPRWPTWPPRPSWSRCAGCPPARWPTWSRAVAGEPARGRAGRALVHERSGGHPFFARELCHLLAGDAAARPARRARPPSAR